VRHMHLKIVRTREKPDENMCAETRENKCKKEERKISRKRKKHSNKSSQNSRTK